MRELGSVRRDIEKAYRKLGNWRAVGEKFGISEGMAWRIVHEGYEPRDAMIRLRLELPAMGVAPVCPRCGIVHVKKRCAASGIRRRDLFSCTDEEIRYFFENREEMKP